MYRLCYVDNWQHDHKKAIFHKWIDNVIHKKDGETILQTLALVEFEDGTLARVDYTSIQFGDTDAYFKFVENVGEVLIQEEETNEQHN